MTTHDAHIAGGTGNTEQGKLLGRDSDVIGFVSAIASGRASIALSKGGARKTYPHTDPNEDAAAFVIGTGGVLVAVADGHSGKDAAHIAIDTLMNGAAGRWTASDHGDFEQSWAQQARDEIGRIQDAILASVVSGARDSARTTLALAVVRPSDGCVAYAAVGDSHIFQVNDVEALDIGYYAARSNSFLGRPADTREMLTEKCRIGTEPLGQTLAIALATDGLSERGIGVDLPESTVLACVTNARRCSSELRPLEAARSIAEAANEAHVTHKSGDNIATAVAWIGGSSTEDRD